MNQSFFLRIFFRSALAILEPQIYVVVEQFGAENISLLSGRLVRNGFEHLRRNQPGFRFVFREPPFFTHNLLVMWNNISKYG